MLSLGPSPGLLHGPPDVRSSLGSTGIAGEVVVFKGTFNSVLFIDVILEMCFTVGGVQGRERGCYETQI